MARARNLKPGYFTNENLADLGPHAHLLFAGLWTIADREGRLEDRARRIKVQLLPFYDVDVDELLSSLTTKGFILRYEVDGERYIQIESFSKHQNPHHMELPSEIPPPLGRRNSFNHTPISPKQRARIYERDGHKCLFCNSNSNLQIDHIKLVSHGGTSDDNNLRTLCAQCNNKRSKKLVRRINRALTLNPITDSLNPLPRGGADAPADMDTKAWIRFVDYRKQIRKPLKPASILAAQRKLAAFGTDQVAVVEQTVANGWQGLFELKDKPRGSSASAQPSRMLQSLRTLEEKKHGRA